MNSPPTEPRPDDPRDDLDRAISAALRQVEPSPGLRERLRAIPDEPAAEPANVVRGPWPGLPRRALWLAAAAMLAVAALFGWRWRSDRWSFDEFRLAVANDVVPFIQGTERPGRMHLDFLAKDPAAIAAWLRAQGAPEPPAGSLLRADAGFGPVGCKALEWNGVRYSLAWLLHGGPALGASVYGPAGGVSRRGISGGGRASGSAPRRRTGRGGLDRGRARPRAGGGRGDDEPAGGAGAVSGPVLD